MFKIFFQKEFC